MPEDYANRMLDQIVHYVKPEGVEDYRRSIKDPDAMYPKLSSVHSVNFLKALMAMGADEGRLVQETLCIPQYVDWLSRHKENDAALYDVVTRRSDHDLMDVLSGDTTLARLFDANPKGYIDRLGPYHPRRWKVLMADRAIRAMVKQGHDKDVFAMFEQVYRMGEKYYRDIAEPLKSSDAAWALINAGSGQKVRFLTGHFSPDDRFAIWSNTHVLKAIVRMEGQEVADRIIEDQPQQFRDRLRERLDHDMYLRPDRPLEALANARSALAGSVAAIAKRPAVT